MTARTIILSCAASWLVLLATAAEAAEHAAAPADPFALDGARNIVEEEHFGIADGKATCGVQYRDAFSVAGLWAPPYVSSDFALGVRILGHPVITERYTWHPYWVDRSGVNQAVGVHTCTMLIPGTRAGVLEITLKNLRPEPRTVPVAISVAGTLDRVAWWEFGRAASKTATTPTVADGILLLAQGEQAIALRGSNGVTWAAKPPSGQASLTLPGLGQAKLQVVFAIGPSAEAKAACARIAADFDKAISEAQAAYGQRVQEILQKLPQLQSSNPSLDHFYYRSLVPLVLNRWDVPEFRLHPDYTTGSVKGGCVCNYLWDLGETWEILPLLDPAAARAHIKQFLATDMTKHFSFDPIGAVAWGPWYPVNQEKIVGLIYYYVKNTGDTAFLGEKVTGKTVLEHTIANAMFGDDPAKPVALIDYGPSNSHLELRLGIPYNHVMPDLNGRRYENYRLAAELVDLAGEPAPQLRQRADELKTLLKQRLWNAKAGWFDFEDAKGHKDLRYTVQIFKLFGSKVLDAEEEAGLLRHLNSEEFLSEFGLHSLARTDVAYDGADIDNGGPGCYTSFPPQIAERLYKAGHADAAENILKRILWWGDRAPYWGDSLVAHSIGYRQDTPLQCTVGGVAGAQCIIFGMFGVRAEFNGDIYIHPRPPVFAPRMELKNLRLRGHVLDIAVAGGQYEVREGPQRIPATVGESVLVRGDQLMRVP